MLVCKKLLLSFAFACCGSLFAQNIQNPVLPGVADAGVMKYNGKYYIGGVRTNGDFYVSDESGHLRLRCLWSSHCPWIQHG